MRNELPEPSTFEALRSRHFLEADLVAVTALRVGSGKRFDAAGTDQPLIRDGLGRPFVPGSSLKGVLRSGLEAVLRALDPGAEGLARPSRRLWACDPFDAPCVRELIDRLKKEPEVGADEVRAAVCPACGLFGSPLLGGRVFVQDLPLLGAPRPEIRDGVGIHRDLGVAQRRPAIKYDFEALPAESRFRLELVLENVDDLQLALVLKTLELLDRGEIRLGGLTSRGLGRVRLEPPGGEAKEILLARTDAERLFRGDEPEPLSYRQEQEAAGERLRALLAPGES